MKLLLTLALFALCPLLASATAITSGTVTLQYGGGLSTFDFSGQGFSVSGEFGPGGGGWSYGGPCDPCTPQYPAMVNGVVSGIDTYYGSATVNGVDLGTVNWGDDEAHPGTQLQAFGQSIPINGPGTYHGTFSFTATMCGTSRQGLDPHACVVDLPNLTGSGTVDVVVATMGVAQIYQTEVYTFVTPEPQTWTLALLGIVPILGWRLKATRRETTNLS